VHWTAVVCLSDCRDPKSKRERRIKLKIGRKEAHDTGDMWPHLEDERSKVRVSKSINAETDWETDELHNWFRDGVH